MVWLDMKNIKTRRPTKKLDRKFTGPYRILRKIGSHAYRLDLPGDLKKIHNVFHVDRLKIHHEDVFKRKRELPPPVFIDGNAEYYIEKVLDSQPLKGGSNKIQYLVKWKDYGEEYNEWVPWQSMAGGIELIEKWEKTHPKKRKLRRELLEELRKMAEEQGEDRKEEEEQRDT